ncbi:hypothetical protein BDW02DRAFT_537749 [Decorospora gaudefroyi]|uniref:DUF7871 domain-containing protein n=1 Tax=Decorospora gaudefroyi TaxID=184978 RepID=A0A6A5K5H4_9PLEO|nr:hypothetical protein BDW02DRAFT_537749 [Decorospora gaudefroyi]
MVCCARNNGTCVCAQEATCSCGKQPALQCTCEKAATENKLPSDASACACGKRAEGTCIAHASLMPRIHSLWRGGDTGLPMLSCTRAVSGCSPSLSKHFL